MTPLTRGTLIQDLLGHWYDVVEPPAGPYAPIRVQALTPVGEALRPLGAPCWASRSMFKPEHVR